MEGPKREGQSPPQDNKTCRPEELSRSPEVLSRSPEEWGATGGKLHLSLGLCFRCDNILPHSIENEKIRDLCAAAHKPGNPRTLCAAAHKPKSPSFLS